MASTRTSLLLLATLALAACETPTTRSPSYTLAEVEAERAAETDAANRSPIAFNEKKPYGHKQVAALQSRLTPVASRINRAAEKFCADMQRSASDCDYPVTLDAHRRELNAYADGEQVVLYPAMVDFTRSEEQLATIVAHEYAHNIMRHRAAKEHNTTLSRILGTAADMGASSAGVNSKRTFNSVARDQVERMYSPEFEAEADYISLYLMARAGYRIDSVPEFWRRMSQANPESITLSQSHPTNPERFVAMTKTIAEIRAKQHARQALIPNIRPNDA